MRVFFLQFAMGLILAGFAGTDLGAQQRTPAARSPLAPPAAADIEPARLAAAGIRKLAGRHLDLYTDLVAAAEIDELPACFDQAAPGWNAYFSVPSGSTAGWRMTGYLMGNPETFRRLGLFPADLPPFRTGYQRGGELWLYEQPSAYYRRHLLLHEGTHGFMNEFLGAAGPPWYMEGVAELLATHRWQDDRLTIGYFPQDREETPKWGRIKIVRDACESQRPLGLPQVFAFGSTAHRELDPYGWCWAAAVFLDAHPRWQRPFRALVRQVHLPNPRFSDLFLRELGEAGPDLLREWQWYVSELDYGFDVPRAAIDARPVQSLPASGGRTSVQAERGWQSSGWRLEAGNYRLFSRGRFQIGRSSGPWWCEPNGITLHYYRGRPLGLLLGTVVDEQDPQDRALLEPVPIGLAGTLAVTRPGTLYLRLNDSPASLADNSGAAEVVIRPE